MLILSREVGETINIGHEISVTIHKVEGNQVRISVKAPKETPVHRKEIYKRIQDEKKASD